MAYAFVQAKWGVGGTTGGPTFDSNVTAGNSILMVWATGGGGTAQTVTGITDDLGNTYTLAKNQAGGSNRRVVVYTAHNIVGGANQIHVAFTGGGSAEGIALEYSGLASTDQVAGDSIDFNPNPSSGNTPATTSANEMVFGVVWVSSTAPTVGSGFTSRNGTAGSNFNFRVEDKRVTSTGVQAATFTAAAMEWMAVCVTCAESGGGATVTYPQLERGIRGLERGLSGGGN